MRIALDVRPLQNESGGRGVGRYVRALMAHLPSDGDEYWYLESRWAAPGEFPPGARGRRLRLLRPKRAITLFDQVATPALCAWKGIDLVHSTFYALPRLSLGRTLRVITVHDLIPLRVPGATGPKNTAIFRQIYRSARGADAVIVPSGRTAADLGEEVGVDRAKVHVIPMGVGPPFAPTRHSSGIERDRGGGSADPRRSGCGPIDRLRSEGARVLLYAGGFDATKNVPFLVEALERLNDPSVRLALVGDPARARASLATGAARESLPDGVVLLGRLDDQDLAAAYRAADLFVSASLYEGFGLPALEAMACGCPVVSLASGAVPEVLDGAASRVEERDPNAFAAAVRAVLEDGAMRADLVAKGLTRAQSLGWDRTAFLTHRLYHELGREA